VSNAIKYTRSGEVRIQTGVQDERVYIQVIDTGPGITPEDVPHLFERFYRGRHVARSMIPGTGLGLAIVKEIIEAHGGTVEVTSELGVGSTFKLWLSLAIS
jgi:signal transduction histidine kinase